MLATDTTQPPRGGFHRIVVCVDSSETARCVAAFARRLAAPIIEFSIVAVALDPHRLATHAALPGVDLQFAHRTLMEDAERAIAELNSALADGAGTVRTRLIDLAKEQADAAHALAAEAREHHADLMIFGIRQHHGLVSWFDPAVTDALSQLAPCAMVVVPAGYAGEHDAGTKRVLFAVDGSPTALAAVNVGALLATSETQMRVVYVVDRALYGSRFVPAALIEDAMAKEGELAIAEAAGQLLSGHGIDAARISADLIRTETSGDDVPAALLREAQRWNADLMVMGTHGRRWIIRTYLGSVPNRVSSLVRIPLIQVCEQRGENPQTEPGTRAE